MIMLLGAACSSVTRATAQIGKLWNLLQVNVKGVTFLVIYMLRNAINDGKIYYL